MNNKETLQEYNEKLEENNVSLANVLTTINNLPETSGNGSSNIYSTTERRVGTWIDGKPIYRKVVIIDSIGSNVNLSIPYNIDDVDTIWLNESASFIKSENETLSSNWLLSADDYMRTWVNKFLGTIRYKTPADLSAFTGYITLEYTKTTD